MRVDENTLETVISAFIWFFGQNKVEILTGKTVPTNYLRFGSDAENIILQVIFHQMIEVKFYSGSGKVKFGGGG